MQILNHTERLILAGETKLIPTMICEIDEAEYKSRPELAKMVESKELEIIEDLLAEEPAPKKPAPKK